MKKHDEKNIQPSRQAPQARMQKEMIIQKLKERGGKITRQRRMLLDIILEGECSSCKEIYYQALSKEEKIGLATVYRMVNTLEELGAISRKNMYRMVCEEPCEPADACTLEFDDGTILSLSVRTWHQIVCSGLEKYGYLQGRELRSIRMGPCASKTSAHRPALPKRSPSK